MVRKKRTHRSLAALLSLITIMSMFPAQVFAGSNADNIIEPRNAEPVLNSNGFYQISNADELYWFAEYANSKDLSANAVLTDDIVVNENVLDDKGLLSEDTSNLRKWTPIGDLENSYTGIFDGDGHTISGLYTVSDNNCQGLIGSISSPGTIKDLGITDSYTEGGARVGTICGVSFASITNCYSSSSVTGESQTGGICGENAGTITNCYNAGRIYGYYYTGGICGGNAGGEVSECYNTGIVTETAYVGGIAGINMGKIINCCNFGNIDGVDDIGGICGRSWNTLINVTAEVISCYNAGFVFGADFYGSICAYSDNNKITACYYLDSLPKDERVNYGDAKGAEQFESGEVTCLLNAGADHAVWGQKIGEDAYPVLNGEKVYAGYVDCGTTEPLYTNTEGILLETKPAHTFSAWESNGNGTHSRTCSVCKAKETEKCSGGTASYFEKAECGACGAEYGKLLTDITPPTGEIRIGNKKWNKFNSEVTSSTYFNGARNVTITAEDDSYAQSGYRDNYAVKIYYYLYSGSNALTTDELNDLTFTEYSGTFSIAPNDGYIIYIKLIDHAGNKTYINSDGIKFDSSVPAIDDIENGKVYCSATEFTVNEDNLDSVTVNGIPSEMTDNRFTVYPANEKQTIVVTDKANNSTTYTITVNDGHTFLNYESNKDATCIKDGTETAKCEYCDATDTAADSGSATGHNWDAPVWSWSEDNKTCSVIFTCLNNSTHQETPKVTVTSAETTPPTCMEMGITAYTATTEFNGFTYTDKKEVTDIPTTDHNYVDGKCTVCGAKDPDFKPVVIAGANGEWMKGEKDGLSFTSNTDILQVQVDGHDLGYENYEILENGTILTLNPEYLETLSAGKHTLTIVTNTGSTDTEFTVKAANTAADSQNRSDTTASETISNDKSKTSPATGSETNLIVLFAAAAVCGVTLRLALISKRKKIHHN